VSVRDITPSSVLAAIGDGHDDVFKLAEHFQVMHVSYTLRSTVTELVDASWIVRVDGTDTFRISETTPEGAPR
jgi:hypothetical protein